MMRDPIRDQSPRVEPTGAPGRQDQLAPRGWTRWQDWGNLILGVWFFVAPWVLDTTHGSTYATTPWNNWWSGGAIIIVSLWLLARPVARWAEWINAALGVWLFVSPWVLGFEDVGRAAWNAWLVGAAVFFLAVWALSVMGGRFASWRGARGPRVGAM